MGKTAEKILPAIAAIITISRRIGFARLASDVGGHGELIEHDKTGLLFRAGSEDDFVKQAVRAAKDAKLRARLGEQARR